LVRRRLNTPSAAASHQVPERLNKLRSPFRSAEKFWVEEIIGSSQALLAMTALDPASHFPNVVPA